MIAIHYPPGARGDFLAGLLLDCVQERENFAVVQPPPSKYTKIHHVTDFTWLERNHTKIRIDSNLNAVNLIRIAKQHLLKNAKTIPVYLDDELDHICRYVHDIIKLDRDCYLHKDRYDYWIDFSYLTDKNFLLDLYASINKTTPEPVLFDLAILNASRQQLELTNEHKKLAELLEFEIKLNLLNKHRTFTARDFVNSTDPQSLLTIKNYSTTSFK